MTEKQKEFTVSELSERYDVTVVTIRRWINKEYFPGAYKGGPGDTSPYRIPESAVEYFESEHWGKVEARDEVVTTTAA